MLSSKKWFSRRIAAHWFQSILLRFPEGRLGVLGARKKIPLDRLIGLAIAPVPVNEFHLCRHLVYDFHFSYKNPTGNTVVGKKGRYALYFIFRQLFGLFSRN